MDADHARRRDGLAAVVVSFILVVLGVVLGFWPLVVLGVVMIIVGAVTAARAGQRIIDAERS